MHCSSCLLEYTKRDWNIPKFPINPTTNIPYSHEHVICDVEILLEVRKCINYYFAHASYHGARINIAEMQLWVGLGYYALLTHVPI